MAKRWGLVGVVTDRAGRNGRVWKGGGVHGKEVGIGRGKAERRQSRPREGRGGMGTGKRCKSESRLRCVSHEN